MHAINISITILVHCGFRYSAVSWQLVLQNRIKGHKSPAELFRPENVLWRKAHLTNSGEEGSCSNHHFLVGLPSEQACFVHISDLSSDSYFKCTNDGGKFDE